MCSTHTRATALLAAVIIAIVATRDAGAQSADNVLLVINDSSDVSRRVGEYYVGKRAIPAGQIVHLNLQPNDQVDRATYVRRVETPIANWLWKHNAQDRILYMVLTKDVPLRIAGTAGPDGTVASVDSELTLLYRKMRGRTTTLVGHTPNPYFASGGFQPSVKPFTHASADIYLVTRLDGYTLADVNGLVDRGLASARDAATGKFVLDQKGSGANRAGDVWLERAANLIRSIDSSHAVVLERTTAVAPRENGVLGYYSWGSNDPAIRTRHPGMTFVPGALAAMFVSTDARTFREPPSEWQVSDWNNQSGFYAGSPQSLTGDLIRDGATGVAGHVAEPYLDATIRPDILFPAYLAGFNLAESFYLAMPYLSWQTVVVGDPLCAPFKSTRLRAEEIDRGLDSGTELPKTFATGVVDQYVVRGIRTDTAVLLAKAEGRLQRAELEAAHSAFEAALKAEPRLMTIERSLAALEERMGRVDTAIDRYRRIMSQSANDVVALNNLAYLLATKLGKTAEALPLAERAATLAPRDPNVVDTLAWVHHLNGDHKRADAVLQQVRQSANGNADIWVHSAAIHLVLASPALRCAFWWKRT